VNQTEAHDALRRALAQVAPEGDLDDVRPDDRFRDALDIDSLDFLALVDRLHAATGIDIPESDYGRVDTVGDMCDYLVAHSA
jgi:acyl carrier protein